MMNESQTGFPLISVIIPVKNGADTIGQCLEAIYKQTLADKSEVVLIDSGSTDATLEIAAKWPVRILSIDPSSFNHGLTRNLGVGQTDGEFIYLTVQDARLADKEAFQRMVSHFQDDQVMAVCGNQAVPHETDKNPVFWHRPISAPHPQKYRFDDPAVLNGLPARERAHLSAWDNVNAMYRRSALDKNPFIRTDFAEDMYWAKTALEKRWTLVRDPGVLTWHYHHRSFDYSFRSAFILSYSVYLFFGILPEYPPFISSLRVIPTVLWREKSIGFRAKYYWFFHSLAAFAGTVYATRVFRKIARGGNEEKIRKAYLHYCRNIPIGRLKGQ